MNGSPIKDFGDDSIICCHSREGGNPYNKKWNFPIGISGDDKNGPSNAKEAI